MTLASHLCHGLRFNAPTVAGSARAVSLSSRSPSSLLRFHNLITSVSRPATPSPRPLSAHALSPDRCLNGQRTYARAATSQRPPRRGHEEDGQLVREKPATARRGNEALRLVLGRPSTLKPRHKHPVGRPEVYTSDGPRKSKFPTNIAPTDEVTAARRAAVERKRAIRSSPFRLSSRGGAVGKTSSRIGWTARNLLRGSPTGRQRDKAKALGRKGLLGDGSLAKVVLAKTRIPIRYRQAVYGLQQARQGRRRRRLRRLEDERAATGSTAHSTSAVKHRATGPLKTKRGSARLREHRTRRPSAARFAVRLVATKTPADRNQERGLSEPNLLAEKSGPRHGESTINALLREDRDVSSKKNALYTTLRRTAYSGRTVDVQKLVDILVRHFDEKPNLKLYVALILVNVAGEGSAARAAQLLEELKDEGLTPDTEVYHAALKALAVHPDCLLRAQIMQDMRSRWLNFTDEGWHDVAAGYIREGNVELAFEHLDEMRRASVPIQPWLSDMLIFVLCDMKEISEVLRLLKQRCSTRPDAIPAGVWYYIFDAACSLMHHPTLHFIWNRRITLLSMNPANGQSLAVLNSASRHGDVALATDVFRILSDRGFLFTTLHYELLMSAYMHPSIGDLRTALTITCIMAGARINITQSSLAPILRYLRTSPNLPPEALNHCKEMVQLEGRSIPVSVVNCLIEASVLQGDLDSALETYKTLHTLSPEGPNVDTFNSLFRGCHHAAQAAYSGMSEERAAERAEERAAIAAAQTAEAAEASEKKRKAVDAAAANVKSTAPSAAAMDVEPGTETLEFATSQLSVKPSSASIPTTTTTSPPPTPATIRTSTRQNPSANTDGTNVAGKTSASKPSPLPPKNTALTLATEMLHLSIAPTSLTYDRLILVCLSQDDMSDALRYYREMREMGFWPRQGTFVAMVGRLWEEWGVVKRRRRVSERAREREREIEKIGSGREAARGRWRERQKKEEEEEENWLELKKVGMGLELKDGNAADDVASGEIGEARKRSKSDDGDGPVDRPLERAWALISVMKERKYRTERLEALLLGEIEA